MKSIEKKSLIADIKFHQKLSEEEWVRQYPEDAKRILAQLDQKSLKKQMFMFYHRAERILEGVCEGRFPEPRKWK